ncbi:MAG: YkgJ family cysteine cluster protein [Ignavibacteria bacterium]|nr:YkgJ family cysteine cluster protein [Ignavibacteria bacterium]
MADFKQKFYDITSLIQSEFDRNLDIYGDKIQCRKGCSKCCSQIFNITLIDVWIIGEHVRSLPAEQREALQQKAREYIDNVVSDRRADNPCPALGAEGECTIYEARPVICRRFGMPIYDYKNPQNVHACELNFKDGDEITDELLVPNQTEIGMKWDELKDEFVASVPRTDINSGTTIAEAIAGA